MLGVSGQITTSGLTRRMAGGSAGCRNHHRGMKLASGGGLLDAFGLRGLPVIGMESMAAVLRQLTGHNLHITPLSLSPTPTSSGDGVNGWAAMT